MTTTSDRRAATLDLPGLDETLQPFGQSKMLPGEAYTSDEVFAWEQRTPVRRHVHLRRS